VIVLILRRQIQENNFCKQNDKFRNNENDFKSHGVSPSCFSMFDIKLEYFVTINAPLIKWPSLRARKGKTEKKIDNIDSRVQFQHSTYSINVRRAQKRKKDSQVSSLFMLSGSALAKAAHVNMLVKSTPEISKNCLGIVHKRCRGKMF